MTNRPGPLGNKWLASPIGCCTERVRVAKSLACRPLLENSQIKVLASCTILLTLKRSFSSLPGS